MIHERIVPNSEVKRSAVMNDWNIWIEITRRNNASLHCCCLCVFFILFFMFRLTSRRKINESWVPAKTGTPANCWKCSKLKHFLFVFRCNGSFGKGRGTVAYVQWWRKDNPDRWNRNRKIDLFNCVIGQLVRIFHSLSTFDCPASRFNSRVSVCSAKYSKNRIEKWNNKILLSHCRAGRQQQRKKIHSHFSPFNCCFVAWKRSLHRKSARFVFSH